jgi:hypothetical protein
VKIVALKPNVKMIAMGMENAFAENASVVLDLVEFYAKQN